MHSSSGGRGTQGPPQQKTPPEPGRRMGMGMSVAALVIAILALLLSLAIPGPAGPPGGVGPAGPPGPGPIANSVRSSPWVTGGLPIVDCTNIHSVDLTVPSAGTIVLVSTVHIWIDHTTGTPDTYSVYQTTDIADCDASSTARIPYTFEVSGEAPTDGFMNLAGTVATALPVAGAGTYTFYLNIDMLTGENSGDRVADAETIATFYAT